MFSSMCKKYSDKYKLSSYNPYPQSIYSILFGVRKLQVKKQQLESNMEQQTGSKLGKECVNDVCCHPVYLFNL